jgi:hypothetical protein
MTQPDPSKKPGPTEAEKERWNRRNVPYGAAVTAGAVANYVNGCIQRERERLAKLIPEHATSILDNSMDDEVFKWKGPKA